MLNKTVIEIPYDEEQFAKQLMLAPHWVKTVSARVGYVAEALIIDYFNQNEVVAEAINEDIKLGDNGKGDFYTTSFSESGEKEIVEIKVSDTLRDGQFSGSVPDPYVKLYSELEEQRKQEKFFEAKKWFVFAYVDRKNNVINIWAIVSREEFLKDRFKIPGYPDFWVYRLPK